MSPSQEFSRMVKTGQRISRWFFVLVTWLICVVLIWDFWNVFQNFTLRVFLNSSLPVFGAMALILVFILLAVFRSAWLLNLFVVTVFFLSIAVLYSYVGFELTERLTPTKTPAQTIKNTLETP